MTSRRMRRIMKTVIPPTQAHMLRPTTHGGHDPPQSTPASPTSKTPLKQEPRNDKLDVVFGRVVMEGIVVRGGLGKVVTTHASHGPPQSTPNSP